MKIIYNSEKYKDENVSSAVLYITTTNGRRESGRRELVEKTSSRREKMAGGPENGRKLDAQMTAELLGLVCIYMICETALHSYVT